MCLFVDTLCPYVDNITVCMQRQQVMFVSSNMHMYNCIKEAYPMKSNIPELVKKSSMTVTEIAQKAGISRSIMSQLANKTELPGKTRFDALEGVAMALEVDISDLFGPRIGKQSLTKGEFFGLLPSSPTESTNGIIRFFVVPDQSWAYLSFSHKPKKPDLIRLEFLSFVDTSLANYLLPKDSQIPERPLNSIIEAVHWKDVDFFGQIIEAVRRFDVFKDFPDVPVRISTDISVRQGFPLLGLGNSILISSFAYKELAARSNKSVNPDTLIRDFSDKISEILAGK